MKKRLPFLIMMAVGFVLWRGGFGFLPLERTLTWRFPLKYSEVRRVDLQVWEGDVLVKREVQMTPVGLALEPSLRVPLTRGVHRALGTVWLESEESRSFQVEFDPGADQDVVIAFAK